MTIHLYQKPAGEEEFTPISAEELQSNCRTIPVHIHNLKLYHIKNNQANNAPHCLASNQYVTLNCLGQLLQRYSPQTDERMLHIALRDMAEKLPQGAIIKLRDPQGVELLALTLPTAIKLLSRSNALAYRNLHDLLVDVLINHLPAIAAEPTANNSQKPRE